MPRVFLYLLVQDTRGPFAEALLYSGYTHLNLSHLFISGVFLASSGAMMDLSMDIASAMDEIKTQYPATNRLALIKSGISVSRHVAGTRPCSWPIPPSTPP